MHVLAALRLILMHGVEIVGNNRSLTTETRISPNCIWVSATKFGASWFPVNTFEFSVTFDAVVWVVPSGKVKPRPFPRY